MKHQQIVVNGKPTTQFDIPLHKGDKIEIGFGKANKPFSHAQLKIVYEDSSLLVVEKAAGLLSMATERIQEKTGASGINILNNNGEAAGQTVNHLHFHIIPRYSEDDAFVCEFKESKKQDLDEDLELVK